MSSWSDVIGGENFDSSSPLSERQNGGECVSMVIVILCGSV